MQPEEMMMKVTQQKAIALGLAAALIAGAALTACADFGVSDPGTSDEQTQYRWKQDDEPSSAERGSIQINEINWAGSVDDDGNYDPDDVFIELRNRYHRPVNLTGWRIYLDGDYEQSFRIPEISEPLDPNAHFVIAAKEDGAFGDVADVVDSRLKLGKRAVRITLRDADRRLIESGGSDTDRPFAGGYDLVTVRSMERTQMLFSNIGSQDSSWHANTDDLNDDFEGRRNIREGWREHTLASPGEPNSADYSGSTAGGGFE